LSKFHDCKIAVKTLPAYCDEWARNDFQQEMNFMKALKFHPHVVCLLGHVSDPTSPLLVLEFCANGDLLGYLRKNKDKFTTVSISGYANFNNPGFRMTRIKAALKPKILYLLHGKLAMAWNTYLVWDISTEMSRLATYFWTRTMYAK
jgi:serine/threonine protein kinase